MFELAIIIPAYKAYFLSRTLDSLSKQTCKNFVVYVGDDASPDNIKSVVDDYKDQINLCYYRFEDNLGGRNLVGHWERCIDLSKGEPWIWLFSDDDEMESLCVEYFFKEIESGSPYDLYHFDVDIIDEHSNIFSHSVFPVSISSYDFAIKRLRGRLSSFVVEYIFSRSIFEKYDRFQKFDLAWGSDDATWIKLGNDRGIKTIKGPHVRWRRSALNITPSNSNKDLALRKINSNICFMVWLSSVYKENNYDRCRIVLYGITWFCANLTKYSRLLGRNERNTNIKKICNLLSCTFLYPFAIIYYHIKRFLLLKILKIKSISVL